MKQKSKYYCMADGMRAGVGLETMKAKVGLEVDGIDVTMEEAMNLTKVLRAMRTMKYNVEHNEYVVNKPSKYRDSEGRSVSTLRIALREHETNEGLWFFNISGNPLKHFEGNNAYGYPAAGQVIRDTFRRCLSWLEKKSGINIVESVHDKVRDGLINIHNLEFAIYTRKCDVDIRPMINAWRYVYRTADWAGVDGMHKSLDQLLSVNSRNQREEYEDSFAVEVMQAKMRVNNATDDMGKIYKATRETVSGLCIYDKSAEMSGDEGVPDEVLDDLKGRLRLDLWLTRVWLARKRIKTVLDLENYVASKHEGEWRHFIVSELQVVLDKTALQYMWGMSNIFRDGERQKIPKAWREGALEDRIVTDEVKRWARDNNIDPHIPYEAHAAIIWALKLKISGADKVEALRNDQAMSQVVLRASAKLEDLDRKLKKRVDTLLNFDTSRVIL
jgi:hypothetical protein